MHDGKSCIKMRYNAEGLKQWAGIYWQHPANNWGDKKGGYNITGATKLTFWARGANGYEIISEVKIGGISGDYSDTDVAWLKKIKLTGSWKKYTIDLSPRVGSWEINNNNITIDACDYSGINYVKLYDLNSGNSSDAIVEKNNLPKGHSTISFSINKFAQKNGVYRIKVISQDKTSSNKNKLTSITQLKLKSKIYKICVPQTGKIAFVLVGSQIF